MLAPKKRGEQGKRKALGALNNTECQEQKAPQTRLGSLRLRVGSKKLVLSFAEGSIQQGHERLTISRRGQPWFQAWSALSVREHRKVATLVFCLTDEFQNVDLPRSERKARYLQRMAQEDDLCLFIRLCDRLNNLRSLSLSPHLEKRRAMIQETEQYLMPVFQHRQGPFSPLEPFLREALMDAKQSTLRHC